MIKMIVSDVDGTLLSHGYIHPKCIESIKKAQEKGKNIYVVVATKEKAKKTERKYGKSEIIMFLCCGMVIH